MPRQAIAVRGAFNSRAALAAPVASMALKAPLVCVLLLSSLSSLNGFAQNGSRPKGEESVDDIIRAQDSIEPLLKELDAKDRAVRLDAMKRLASLGPKAGPAIDRLIAALARFDDEERTLAVAALAGVQKAAIAALEKLLHHDDELLRHDSVWALGLMGSIARDSVPRLLELVRRDADAHVRAKAVFALARIDARDVGTMRTLAKIAADEKSDYSLRIAIIDQLPSWGEPAIVPLGEALRAGATDFCADLALAKLLAAHKTKTAAEAMRPYIIDAYARAEAREADLRARSPSARSYLYSELCEGPGMGFVLATVGAQLIDPLEKQLHGPSKASRIASCKCLAQMARTLHRHKQAPELVEQIVKRLIPFLQHEDRDIREALAANFPATTKFAAALEELQFDRDSKVRYAVRLTLMAYGVDGAGPRAYERFAKAEGPEQFRLATGLLYCDRAIVVMREALTQANDAELRHQAAYLVGSSHGFEGTKPEELTRLAAPRLIESLQSKDALKRAQAAEGLAVMGALLDSAQIAIVIAALAEKDKIVRTHAVGALAWQSHEHPKVVLPVVAPFLRDRDAAIRFAAVTCFAKSQAPGLPELLNAFEREDDPTVRLALREALTKHAADSRVFHALLGDAEIWPDVMRALALAADDTTTPKLLAVVAKNDEMVRLTLGELPKSAKSLIATAEALTTMIERKDLAVNRRAVHTLTGLLPLLGPSLRSPWLDKSQSALLGRMPEIENTLKTGDLRTRREAVELLAEIASFQEGWKPPWLPFVTDGGTPSYDLATETPVSELLALARRDSELTIRRLARKSAWKASPVTVP